MSHIADVFSIDPSKIQPDNHVAALDDKPPLSAPPERTPQAKAATFVLENGWFIIVFPDTDKHFAMAKKLADSRPGALVPLTQDEMALLVEFMPWPNRPHTGSF